MCKLITYWLPLFIHSVAHFFYFAQWNGIIKRKRMFLIYKFDLHNIFLVLFEGFLLWLFIYFSEIIVVWREVDLEMNEWIILFEVNSRRRFRRVFETKPILLGNDIFRIDWIKIKQLSETNFLLSFHTISQIVCFWAHTKYATTSKTYKKCIPKENIIWRRTIYSNKWKQRIWLRVFRATRNVCWIQAQETDFKI